MKQQTFSDVEYSGRKHNIGTQAMAKDFKELEDHTNSFMKRLSEDKDHVKSYFDHPAIKAYKLDWIEDI